MGIQITNHLKRPEHEQRREEKDTPKALMRLELERAENIKIAKQYVFDGYACARDSYEHDDDYILYLRKCLTRAHTHLQKV